MSDTPAEPIPGAEVTIDFVHTRNVMLVRGDLSPLFVDYYLHVADQKLKIEPAHARLFKDLLAAFALHCAQRPLFEHVAWTIGLQDPRLNLFVTGDNEDCTVAGRVFTENVRVAERNVFYSDLLPRRGAEKRRSVVNFDGADIFRAVETYYAQSEQRTARYFDLGEDRYALLVSHPDCDEAWLRAVDLEGVKRIDATDKVARIDRRPYRWECGCTQQKIMGALAPAARDDLGALFHGDESIHVQCPRCATGHVITREAMEAHLAQSKPQGPAT